MYVKAAPTLLLQRIHVIFEAAGRIDARESIDKRVNKIRVLDRKNIVTYDHRTN